MHLEHCIVLLLGLNVMLCNCGPMPRRFRFCGKHLSDALALACASNGGGYNVPYWDNPAVKSSMDAKSASSGRGVATECCYIGCTWRTLVSYCQGEPKPRAFGELELEKLSFVEIIDGANRLRSAPQLAAAAAEVGIVKERKGHKARKGRRVRGGRKGRTPNACMRRKRPAVMRKVAWNTMNIENIKRSAPVFGTVSPEYLRLPRTLDGVPSPHFGFQQSF